MEAIHLLTQVVCFASVSTINFTIIGFRNTYTSFNISTEFLINLKICVAFLLRKFILKKHFWECLLNIALCCVLHT